MLAFVYSGPWQVALKDWPAPPAPKGSQVLVNIKATGVCGTDLGIIKGAYAARNPVVLGHESAGIVAAAGDQVTSLKPGDRVVIDPTCYCGFCRMCRSGRQNHCERKSETETGVSRDGTLAPLYLTDERFLYPLDDHVTLTEAALTEPLSCVLTGVAQIRVFAGQRTVVIGGGPIGLLYASVLSLYGVSGILVELSSWRQTHNSSILGNRWKIVSFLNEAVDSMKTFDLVIDTTGLMAESIIPRLANGGQLLLVGLREGKVTFDPGDVANRSLSIVGSIDSLGTFSSACSLISNGAIPAQRIVSHTFPLDQILEALDLLGCNVREKRSTPDLNAMKVIIEP